MDFFFKKWQEKKWSESGLNQRFFFLIWKKKFRLLNSFSEKTYIYTFFLKRQNKWLNLISVLNINLKKNNNGGAIKFELPINPNYINIFCNDMQINKKDNIHWWNIQYSIFNIFRSKFIQNWHQTKFSENKDLKSKKKKFIQPTF